MEDYSVVRPIGKSGIRQINAVPQVNNLESMKVGIFWTIFTNGDVLADFLITGLQKKYNGLSAVKLPASKSAKWGDYPDETISEVVTESGINAAIVLVGG